MQDTDTLDEAVAQIQHGLKAQHRHLMATIASHEELLTRAAEDAAVLRRELWETRRELDEARAQVDTISADTGEDAEGEDASLVHDAVSHMKEQIILCEEAVPRRRRWYYPCRVSSLPSHLRALSQCGLQSAIEETKQWVKERAKRRKATKGEVQGE